MDSVRIADSWKRCQDFGLSPFFQTPAAKLPSCELEKHLKQNEKLIQKCRQLFSMLGRFFQEGTFTAVLVDKEGIVLERAGSLRRAALDEALAPGTNWSEQAQGTNAMGIVLSEKKPAVVHGEHHFYIGHRMLTCAAAPVFSGETFLGAVNISTRKENYHPLLLSMAVLIAESVKESAEQEEMDREIRMLVKMIDFPLAALEGREIVHVTPSAGRQRHLLQREKLEAEWMKAGANSRRIWYRQEYSEAPDLYRPEDFTGSDPRIQQLRRLVERASEVVHPVLLYGESGTGKEIIAQSIHSAGIRSGGPFQAVNCSAVPESLIESEWFGYEKGAFTGALQHGRPGKFELADKGTIFLDEAAELSPKAQAVLLRILQDQQVQRIGSVKPKQIDVRVVAATNKDLQNEVMEGRFREDLYYRLRGITLTIPPLRERSDILELKAVLEKRYGLTSVWTAEAERKLLRWHFPGNVRELAALLIEADFFAEGGDVLPDHVSLDVPAQASGSRLKDVEKTAVAEALRESGFNISSAASRLAISRSTLYAKMKKFGLHDSYPEQ
ncbi:sigma-54-dependent Fis family transcriptional regulator [Alkalicoccus urumqiensis]|uniref:Sigma-54-dependent Fis family transcriptional regulator n=1 Tax=Alkalicoccus urumqiensis TaxID=1548213 RepID=A0A2P6MIY9_ALKUR|nr:sigma 54-interacting transcriptional regulator [Alkalicoccus urumqiensis]PRO66242.1 sigma-54-dependent Fis family transcriptional regulator [Alkalicoccus urumqiensis]